MKIALIGFMGCGKSTVGARLTEILHTHCVESDALVLARSGRESIAEIFELDGESRFRDIEEQVISEVCNSDSSLISCGGGVVTRENNRVNLLRAGFHIVFLDAPFEELARRVAASTDRPLFRNLDQAHRLYEERLPLYRAAATNIVSTAGRTAQSVANELLITLLRSAA